MKKNSEKYGEIIRYLIIGALTTVISIVVYYGLTMTVFNPKIAVELQIANIIQWICAVVFAYYTNKYYVFKDNSRDKKSIIKFFTSRISTLLMEMLLMYLFVTVLSLNDKIMKVIAQILVIIVNYLLSKYLVFKHVDDE